MDQFKAAGITPPESVFVLKSRDAVKELIRFMGTNKLPIFKKLKLSSHRNKNVKRKAYLRDHDKDIVKYIIKDLRFRDLGDNVYRCRTQYNTWEGSVFYGSFLIIDRHGREDALYTCHLYNNYADPEIVAHAQSILAEHFNSIEYYTNVAVKIQIPTIGPMLFKFDANDFVSRLRPLYRWAKRGEMIEKILRSDIVYKKLIHLSQSKIATNYKSSRIETTYRFDHRIDSSPRTTNAPEYELREPWSYKNGVLVGEFNPYMRDPRNYRPHIEVICSLTYNEHTFTKPHTSNHLLNFAQRLHALFS